MVAAVHRFNDNVRHALNQESGGVVVEVATAPARNNDDIDNTFPDLRIIRCRRHPSFPCRITRRQMAPSAVTSTYGTVGSQRQAWGAPRVWSLLSRAGKMWASTWRRLRLAGTRSCGMGFLEDVIDPAVEGVAPVAALDKLDLDDPA